MVSWSVSSMYALPSLIIFLANFKTKLFIIYTVKITHKKFGKHLLTHAEVVTAVRNLQANSRPHQSKKQDYDTHPQIQRKHGTYLVSLDSQSGEVVDDVLFELFLLLRRISVVEANQKATLVPLRIVLI